MPLTYFRPGATNIAGTTFAQNSCSRLRAAFCCEDAMKMKKKGGKGKGKKC